ncbi:MAG: thioredoxin family protein [Arcobacter sp.]|mgnify:CR=1 FL=1|nr:MAG: thioredoxin family protein [Arcobacter sp.]
MIKKGLFLLLSLFIAINLQADFNAGKKLFEEKCASCHKEYVSFKKLKENFFKRNNTLLNLTIPTENMLAWAIMESSKRIGDPEDPEIQLMEIEEYLKSYLENPDINDSICDRHVLKYYVKKEPIIITEEESTLLAQYFMGYKSNRLKNYPNLKKSLADNPDEEKILSKAINEGKQLIVFATAKSCYFCKKMKKEVLSLKDVKDEINEDYIFIEIDVDLVKLPFGLDKKFKGMTPTFFVLNQDGILLNTYPGAWVKDDFLLILKENL